MKKTLILLAFISLIINFAVDAQSNNATVKQIPFASIGGIQIGKIDKTILMKADKIDCSDNLEITSFTLSVSQNGLIREIQGKGNKIDSTMKSYIRRMEDGQKVFVENIQAKSPVDGKAHALAALVFTVSIPFQTPDATIKFPYASISGFRNGIVEKAILMKAEKVDCSEKGFEIISFNFSIDVGDGMIREVKGNSNNIDAEMKKLIDFTKSGNKVFFENIKAKISDGSIMILEALIFEIQ